MPLNEFMTARKKALALVLLLVVTNAYWTYRTFDNEVTMSYMEASLNSANDRYSQALVLANLDLVGMTSDKAVERIGTDIHGLEPFEKEGCLFVGQICLVLDNQRRIVRVGRE